MGRTGKAMIIAVASVLGILVAGILFLAAISPGKSPPITASDGKPLAGSISEKGFIEVNGDRQGLFLKGRDRTRPVLLYLHGGMPDYFLTGRYPTGLEDLFVVAWWEQRGSGISYNPKAAGSPITLDMMVDDTIEMANYLRKRFSVDKVYLMAHSGGSFIGINAVKKAPALFAAYIGMAQVSNQLESEVLAYDYMLKAFRDSGDAGMVKRLEGTPVTRSGGVPAAYAMTRDVAMHALGIGTMHDMRSIVTGILLPSLAFREYSLAEKYHMWAAKAHSGIATLWSTVMATDLSKTVTRLEVPVYFLEGVHDYTCSYVLAKAYFSGLDAPVKGFYSFSQSAHSPIFEEPEKVRAILETDVLMGRASLADR
jgi:pimeloyl-ACP methyl ester carboxylesterase